MLAEKQAKTVLEAKSAHGAVRLCKSRVALFEDESPVVSNPGDLPSRYNPVPLLRFFALWKLHSIQKKQEPFQATSADHKWATQLYDLIKNCGKKESCWLETVFGSHSTTPHVCSVHKVIKAFKDGREHVVSLAKTCPDPDQIKLTLDGTPAESGPELQEFLQRLGVGDEILTSPASQERETLPTATFSGTDADATCDKQPPFPQIAATYRPFDNCGTAQDDFRKRCIARLRDTDKLRIRWLGLVMQFGNHFLQELLLELIRARSACDITLSIAMLDPKYEHLPQLNRNWPSLAAVHYDSLLNTADWFSGLSGDQKVTTEISRYRYVPNWHGFAIDNSFCYISYCSWQNGLLGGAYNKYVLFDAQQSEFARELATAFDTWFAFAFKKSLFSSGPKVFSPHRLCAASPRRQRVKG